MITVPEWYKLDEIRKLPIIDRVAEVRPIEDTIRKEMQMRKNGESVDSVGFVEYMKQLPKSSKSVGYVVGELIGVDRRAYVAACKILDRGDKTEIASARHMSKAKIIDLASAGNKFVKNDDILGMLTESEDDADVAEAIRVLKVNFDNTLHILKLNIQDNKKILTGHTEKVNSLFFQMTEELVGLRKEI